MLDWRDDHGFLKVTVPPLEVYDNTYFEKYIGYAATYMGRLLTKARLGFVLRHFSGSLLDFGIGSGHFLGECDKVMPTYGYDINPIAIQYLQSCEKYGDPLLGWDAMTFWDSLEHLEDPAAMLKNVKQWAFVSIPIFEDRDHALRSKHFRPDEHWWYFTEKGFIRFMNRQGFVLMSLSRFEEELGREDIGTFAFKRMVDV